MEQIRLLFCGAGGKMGQAMLKGIMAESDITIVGAVDLNNEGKDLGLLLGVPKTGILIRKDLAETIQETEPHVMVDFTTPEAVKENIRIAVEQRVACVVGTTGLTPGDMDEIKLWTEKYTTPVLIAPNFALGAVLMMCFAQEAGKYFPSVEIIEKHHDQKIDSPSGTALKTMELISKERKAFHQGADHELEKITGCRGGEVQGMRVHSIRLPGFVAQQEVIFGGNGQTLTIRHDTINRDSFIPGVVLAVRNVRDLKGVVYGLENLLW